MERVHLIVHSDYLCPWCYNGSVRVQRLIEEFGDQLHVDWRSFLLRPQVDPNRTLEKFKEYTRSWQRPAEDENAGTFRIWSTDVGPPSHSIPPHLVAKAAALVSPEAFHGIHERLLHGYFAENRDITDTDTLRAIWTEAALPAAAFDRHADPALRQRVLDEHAEAADLGITGVPAVRMADRDGFVLGAQPLEVYRRWIRKALAE
jgi:predicted DsbA family dithiol-disulfide isomerase